MTVSPTATRAPVVRLHHEDVPAAAAAGLEAGVGGGGHALGDVV